MKSGQFTARKSLRRRSLGVSIFSLNIFFYPIFLNIYPAKINKIKAAPAIFCTCNFSERYCVFKSCGCECFITKLLKNPLRLCCNRSKTVKPSNFRNHVTTMLLNLLKRCNVFCSLSHNTSTHYVKLLRVTSCTGLEMQETLPPPPIWYLIVAKWQ